MVGFSWFFGGMMVLLTITGLAMMETGCAKSKNAGSVMMEAIIAVTIAIPCFLLVGGIVSGLGESSAMMLEAMLAALVCCILAGGIIGRMTVAGFMTVCAVAALLSYPLSVRACRILGGFGAYQDFGGFGTVFLSGAAAAYAASRMLGTRMGKGAKDAASVVPGHNIPFALAGVLLFCVGLLGMAGANGLLIEIGEDMLSRAAENMVIGGSVSGLAGLLFTYIRYKKPDITMTAGAAAAGFVAAVPGCDSVASGWMCLIGVLAGFFTIIGIESVERGGRVDDPAGVAVIFGIGGGFGLLGTGIFNSQTGLRALPGNLAAILLIFVINGVLVGVTEAVLNRFGLLRISKEQEMEGVDLCEYGLVSSYYDFQLNLDTTDWTDLYVQAKSEGESTETFFKEPYVYDAGKEPDIPLTKLEIICRKEKLEALKMALNDIGIMGMTVSGVTGCGVQKGYNEYYRGVPISVQLRAKVRIEVVVAKIPVDEVVNTARRVLFTGHVGDGKIFIYSLNDVVRVRTGESGYAAMQGALSE